MIYLNKCYDYGDQYLKVLFVLWEQEHLITLHGSATGHPITQ